MLAFPPYNVLRSAIIVNSRLPFRTPVCRGAKMQIDLTGAVAWDLPLPSKPQCLNTTPIWAEGNERAMHPLFAPKWIRVHRLVQQLIQKPAAEYLAPAVWHHSPRFSDESPFS